MDDTRRFEWLHLPETAAESANRYSSGGSMRGRFSAVGMLIATAPVTANAPGESSKALLFSGFFAVLWLISGAFFRAAAQTDS